jgi:hypothetical protein
MSITSSNAIIQISVTTIFPNGVELQRFTTDDIYGSGQIKKNITKMGVDGFQSAGKVWVSVPITYHLQPDSPSCAFFDAWAQAEDQLEDTLSASGLIILPGIATKYAMVNGALGDVSPVPAAGQTLKERSFEIIWNRLIPSPYVGGN